MKNKESVFVTNDYFYKFGLNRQSIQYQIKNGDIRPFGKLKGMFLYYQSDADLMIIKYWMNNFGKFELPENSEIKEMLFEKINREFLFGLSSMGIATASYPEIVEMSMKLLDRISAYEESGLDLKEFKKKEKYLRSKGLSYLEIKQYFDQKNKNESKEK
jgi:tRNA-dihydrouridine synthase